MTLFPTREASMYEIYCGSVRQGHGMASGRTVGQSGNDFPAGTLRMQQPYFQQRDFDFEQAIPNLYWGTINVQIDRELVLIASDITLETVDWTRDLPPSKRIDP